mmetsp:Transcript_27558/g.70196  ORF Transcript_27558/g.70196 Transcript_27558/m.70196 type:complete len:297 (-) Transcript_27558:1005-1895(-)
MFELKADHTPLAVVGEMISLIETPNHHAPRVLCSENRARAPQAPIGDAARHAATRPSAHSIDGAHPRLTRPPQFPPPSAQQMACAIRSADGLRNPLELLKVKRARLIRVGAGEDFERLLAIGEPRFPEHIVELTLRDCAGAVDVARFERGDGLFVARHVECLERRGERGHRLRAVLLRPLVQRRLVLRRQQLGQRRAHLRQRDLALVVGVKAAKEGLELGVLHRTTLGRDVEPQTVVALQVLAHLRHRVRHRRALERSRDGKLLRLHHLRAPVADEVFHLGGASLELALQRRELRL